MSEFDFRVGVNVVLGFEGVLSKFDFTVGVEMLSLFLREFCQNMTLQQ